MESITIDSSWIKSADYENNRMTLHLKNNRTFDFDLSEDEWNQFKNSPSKGAFIQPYLSRNSNKQNSNLNKVLRIWKKRK